MKNKFSILFVLFIFLYAIRYTLYPVYAQAPGIGYSRLTPTSPLYFLKGVRESLELKFAGTPRDKMQKRLEIATRRLKEARTLISQGQGLVLPTLERYTGEINSLPDKYQEKDEFGQRQRVKDALKLHLATLQEMYSPAQTNVAKMAIRSAMNRIIQRADVDPGAKAAVCRLFAEEASSSALNDTERVVLARRAENCF